MADELASAPPSPQTPPAIHVRAVDTGRGVAWWGEGWRLFAPAVGPWILIVIIGFVFNMVLAFIPVLGSIASQLLFPVLMGGLMLGCRAIDRGEPLTVAHLFAGFGPKAGPLLVVGLIYIVAAIAILMVVVAVVVVLFGAAVLSQLWSAQNSPDIPALSGILLVILVCLLLFLLLYLPLVMAVWFAPALVVLQGVEPWTAMKLSFAGSIRNILPFLIYSLVWIVLAIVATIPLLLGWLVLGPMAVASLYASYCDIFEQPQGTSTGTSAPAV
jgi:uncharacterized membrane protein